jgi:hypothetical protein
MEYLIVVELDVVEPVDQKVNSIIGGPVMCIDSVRVTAPRIHKILAV